jgi:3-methyladenine DNA glycosylase/8-oxoguanine DNA glycosylase
VQSAHSPSQVAALIVRRDRSFRSLVIQIGPPPRWKSARVDDRFAALVRAITFQLLATKAAETIHGRVRDLCDQGVTTESIRRVGVDQLRGAGLSRTKAEAMVDLANQVSEQRVQLGRHGRMGDAEVTDEVTAVRGIGPWTAHMYLLSTLARADVWPVGDFGVRKGWSIVHGLDEIISESDLAGAGDRFESVRSSVAWYCWQAVHLDRQAN